MNENGAQILGADKPDDTTNLYVPGEKHRVRLWLRGGPPEGLTYLVNFATSPDWVPPPGFNAKLNAMITIAHLKTGKIVGAPPVEDAEDGIMFFWGEIVCARYEGPVRPGPQLYAWGKQ